MCQEVDAHEARGSIGVDDCDDRSLGAGADDLRPDRCQRDGFGVGQPPRRPRLQIMDEESGHLADEVEFVSAQFISYNQHGLIVDPAVQVQAHPRQFQGSWGRSPEQPHRRSQIGLAPVRGHSGDDADS